MSHLVLHDQVWIPSRGRVDNLEKLLPAWWSHNFEVRVVVAVGDAGAYRTRVKQLAQEGTPETKIVVLNYGTQGMGAIRRDIVKMANAAGQPAIIMSDDDIIPHHSANPSMTLTNAVPPWDSPLGVGCVVSQHDLLLGDQAWRLKDPKRELIFCSSGYGFRMFAINIQAALDCGNFDRKLDVCFEDAEFMRQGIVNGYLWWLDPGLRAVALGKRFAAGGIESLAPSASGARQARTLECHRLVHSRWPRFMSDPSKAPRFAWKRFIDEYVPDWREEYMK